MTRPDQAAQSAWAGLRPEIEQLFARQWRQPELPCLEHASSAALADWLEGRGFAVERGAGGVPTAFVARRALAGPGPRVAFLAEYDALPGLDNAAEPERRPLGLRAGHGCGHNHIGPANSGAAVAAAEAASSLGLGGEIVVVGCPAEEILWGKIALLHRGIFDGVDILLTSHGDYQTGALSRPCASIVSGEFVFAGSAGHAGKVSAVNALEAAELAIQMMEKIRTARFPGVGVRHVIRRGGDMPGVTPSESRVWITTRSFDFNEAQAGYAAVAEAFGRAAEATGTTVREQFIVETRGYLPNDTLGRVLFDVMQERGAPPWSNEHLAWMGDLVRSCAGGEMTLDREVRFYDTGVDYYGQDDGDLSWRIPLGRVNWAYPEEVPIHHWAWTALSGHAAGTPGPLLASEVLAAAALRILERPAIVDEARAELVRRTGGRTPDLPRIGAWSTLTQSPESFWDGTWVE